MPENLGKILASKPRTEKALLRLKRRAAKRSGRPILRNSEILEEYRRLLAAGKIGRSENLENLLRKRAVRTLSGVAPVAVLTKPFPCPGRCAYCPSEKGVPQSYLSNEPAVMRAIRNKYDPYEQVRSRLAVLEANGHRPEKIELIVIGGTWSVLPTAYKFWFIKECFLAANEFSPQSRGGDCGGAELKKSPLERGGAKRRGVLKAREARRELEREQNKNEKAKYKIIGLTLETRPDHISEKELIEMRELGATRVEMGVQAIDDKILKLNQRGHDVAEIARATKLLKDFGFKVTYHLMPALPGATAKKDLAMFKRLFSDPRFQPDQIKFYPTVVVKGSLLYKWWKAGKYKPYSDKVLQNLIVECKKIVPPYVRIIRLIRDIPAESIEAGNVITNLRQIMQQRGTACNCIRCRECRDEKIPARDLKMNIIKYEAAGGEEYFISFDSRDKKTLYGFCRLRLSCHPERSVSGAKDIRSKKMASASCVIDSSPGAQNDKKKEDKRFNFLNQAAMVRELHVYGELVPVGGKYSTLGRDGSIPLSGGLSAPGGRGGLARWGGFTQHTGLGKRLLAEAEKIARKNGYKEIAVISGIGARGYYKKLGYRLKAGYLVKNI